MTNCVALTRLDDGKWVSTVKLEDYYPGHLFETMVFPRESHFSELDCRRYFTEDDARKGHAEMVEKWSARDDL
jgi:hypothetical protein